MKASKREREEIDRAFRRDTCENDDFTCIYSMTLKLSAAVHFLHKCCFSLRLSIADQCALPIITSTRIAIATIRLILPP